MHNYQLMQNQGLNYHLSESLKFEKKESKRNRKFKRGKIAQNPFNTSNYTLKSLNTSKYSSIKNKNSIPSHSKRMNRNLTRIHTNHTYSTTSFPRHLELVKSQTTEYPKKGVEFSGFRKESKQFSKQNQGFRSVFSGQDCHSQK